MAHLGGRERALGVGRHNQQSPACLTFKLPLKGGVRRSLLDHREALAGKCAFVVDFVLLMKGSPDLLLPSAGHLGLKFLGL